MFRKEKNMSFVRVALGSLIRFIDSSFVQNVVLSEQKLQEQFSEWHHEQNQQLLTLLDQPQQLKEMLSWVTIENSLDIQKTQDTLESVIEVPSPEVPSPSVSSISSSSFSNLSSLTVSSSDFLRYMEKSESEDNIQSKSRSLDSHTSKLVDCSKAFKKPHSYKRYPIFEQASEKLAQILQQASYKSFVFGGVIYRKCRKPGDLDMVIPNFMNIKDSESLTSRSSVPQSSKILARIKDLVRLLDDHDIRTEGWDGELQIPGYPKEKRYMLPLFMYINGQRVQVDLTLYAGDIIDHARDRDFSISMFYYDPLDKKMYRPSFCKAALSDLNSKTIRLISAPIALIQRSPKLVFDLIKLQYTEEMSFCPGLVSAIENTLGKKGLGLFDTLSDASLRTELMCLESFLLDIESAMHEKPSKTVIDAFYATGFADVLYERLQKHTHVSKLIEYRNMMNFESRYHGYYYHPFTAQYGNDSGENSSSVNNMA
jgi:hypothetical protein